MINSAISRLMLTLFCCLAPALPGWTQDAGPGDFDEIAAWLFWDELHPYGGWTLYCGHRFGDDRKTSEQWPVSVAHIYPLSGMLKRAGCKSRMQCRESGNALFRHMEANMHNLYPVWSTLATQIDGMEFGEVEGEEWRFKDCDIEWRNGIVEPRPVSRGNVARALYYMHWRYEMPLRPSLLPLLRRWNREDAPSEQERFRNDRIQVLQGQRNPFIDNSALMGKPLAQVKRPE